MQLQPTAQRIKRAHSAWLTPTQVIEFLGLGWTHQKMTPLLTYGTLDYLFMPKPLRPSEKTFLDEDSPFHLRKQFKSRTRYAPPMSRRSAAQILAATEVMELQYGSERLAWTQANLEWVRSARSGSSDALRKTVGVDARELERGGKLNQLREVLVAARAWNAGEKHQYSRVNLKTMRLIAQPDISFERQPMMIVAAMVREIQDLRGDSERALLDLSTFLESMREGRD